MSYSRNNRVFGIEGTLGYELGSDFYLDHEDSPAYKFRDVKVIDKRMGNWPGPQKNVHAWYVLDNGYAVGWNENPNTGWSFPVVRMKKFYIKERHNPQTGVYYKACGQLSKKEAAKKENSLYGTNIMFEFDTQLQYEHAIEELKQKKERFV